MFGFTSLGFIARGYGLAVPSARISRATLLARWTANEINRGAGGHADKLYTLTKNKEINNRKEKIINRKEKKRKEKKRKTTQAMKATPHID